jgi:AraC family transcriptional regulator, regulatory protein of adaptative response / methylphosphotriester-DNA alkyltransferase methyltransferase
LTRLFRQQFGLTPAEYLGRLRLKKAVECLSTAQMNLLNIAFICGFGSLSGFYAHFKKQFGITPGKYRQRQYLTTH